MSYRGIMSNNLYVSVDIIFDKVWDALDSNEQKKIVQNNIDMIDDDVLIAELEARGYNVQQDED